MIDDTATDEALNGAALLPFLKLCTAEELDPLVRYIDASGMGRVLSLNETFKQHQPDHTRYLELIDRELRSIGGNSFANAFLRGFEGPAYGEIVADVCSRHKVKVTMGDSVAAMELALICKLAEDRFAAMTPEEKRAFLENLIGKADGFDEGNIRGGVPLSMILSQMGIRMAGFTAYRTALIVANWTSWKLLGSGLTFAANTLLTRSMGIFAGPIAVAASVAWFAFDIAGPNHKTMTACVATIAALRQMKLAERAGARSAAA